MEFIRILLGFVYYRYNLYKDMLVYPPEGFHCHHMYPSIIPGCIWTTCTIGNLAGAMGSSLMQTMFVGHSNITMMKCATCKPFVIYRGIQYTILPRNGVVTVGINKCQHFK